MKECTTKEGKTLKTKTRSQWVDMRLHLDRIGEFWEAIYPVEDGFRSLNNLFARPSSFEATERAYQGCMALVEHVESFDNIPKHIQKRVDWVRKEMRPYRWTFSRCPSSKP